MPDHIFSEEANRGDELVYLPDESSYHTDISCLVLAPSEALEAQKAVTLLLGLSILCLGKGIH